MRHFADSEMTPVGIKLVEDELGLERAMCQAVKDGASGWVTVSSLVPELNEASAVVMCNGLRFEPRPAFPT